MNKWEVKLKNDKCIYKMGKEGCINPDNPLTQMENGQVVEHGPCDFADCPIAIDGIENIELPF